MSRDFFRHLRWFENIKREIINRCSATVLCAGGLLLFASSTTAVAGCNSGNFADSALLNSADCQASAPAQTATAIGANALATDKRSVAVGYFAQARQDYVTSVGWLTGTIASEIKAGATNIGAGAGALGGGLFATAVGGGIGLSPSYGAQATGDYSIALGGGDGANFSPVGPDIVISLNAARATGFVATAIGTASEASGGGSTAIGLYSRALANDSIAFGEFSTASADKSISIGLFSEAAGARTVAIGNNARATKTGAVAIGANSLASAANTVSVGSASIKRRITNLAAGKQASDAVTLAQLQAATASSPHATEQVSRSEMDSVRAELSELRALVRQQQALIAKLGKQQLANAIEP